MSVWIQLLACSLLVGAPAQERGRPGGAAGALDTNVASLKGLHGVMAWITFVPSQLKAVGLEQDVLQTWIAGEMKEAGVNAYPLTTYDRSPAAWRAEGQPSLTIDLSLDFDTLEKSLKHGRMTFSLQVRLYQNCRLERDPPISLALVTWESHTPTVTGTAEELKRSLRGVLAQFAADYKRANATAPNGRRSAASGNGTAAVPYTATRSLPL